MSGWRLKILSLIGIAATTWMFAGAFRTTMAVRQPAPADDAKSIGRMVVIVLDGLDYRLTKEAMERGDLPTFSALAKKGAFEPLESELPPESPVALASLQTGVNPGRHGIFDFVTRDLNYRPQNGMVSVQRARLALGRVPIRPPRVASRLKAPTFSDVVWQAGYPVLSLRQSLNFPTPARPGAWMTSGLGTPDIAGSAGFYAVYSNQAGFFAGETEMGGRRIPLSSNDGGVTFETYLEGPPDPAKARGESGELRHARLPLTFRVTPGARVLDIDVNGETERIQMRDGRPTRSGHFRVVFKLSTIPAHTVHGVVRFNVRSIEPLVVVTEAVNMRPGHTPMPISTPDTYATELQSNYGPFETVGWQEQTFQLNDGWQDDAGFLEDLLEDMDISRAQLLGELRRKPEARLVFMTVTATDRAAHCFYRYLDEDHPARQTAKLTLDGDPYLRVLRHADEYIAAVERAIDPGDTLIVCSDHGFATWRYAVNLNQWLVNEGYMVLRDAPGAKSLGAFFRDARPEDAVDWSKTRAYAMGLGQIYINRAGRESRGIVEGNDVDALMDEIQTKLRALKNPLIGEQSSISRSPVHKVYRLHDHYYGPLLANAPDLQVGFARGYRVSWQTALLGGMRSAGGHPVIEPNERAWSGDHCSCDPSLVPGVLLTNRPLQSFKASRKAHVRDIAATVMTHFGCSTAHLDGAPLHFEVSPK